MQLGNFSISLSVKDIVASKAFYEMLGFAMVLGAVSQGWAIMKNGETNIGLFQGMFERNTLTFNPGWDHDGNELETFTDIRDIQKRLKESGIQFALEAEDGSGPAAFMIMDPDGNPILVDQHVASKA
jgi:catechol 2,3-dioxygenase-like lactoylglutathione lyase family enzyme